MKYPPFPLMNEDGGAAPAGGSASPSAPAPAAPITPVNEPSPVKVDPSTGKSITVGESRLAGEIFDDQLMFKPGFIERLPDDQYGEVKGILGTAKGLKSLADGYKHWMTEARSKREGYVKVPGPDATDDDKAAWRQAMGIPESADQYKIEVPQDLPEGIRVRDEAINLLRNRAAEKGWPQQFVSEAMELNLEVQQMEAQFQQQEVQQMLAQDEAELKKAWPDQQSREKNELRFKVVAEKLGLDPSDPLLGAARIKIALANAADAFLEDGGLGDGDFGPASRLAALEQEFDKIRSDPRYQDGDPTIMSRARHIAGEIAKLNPPKGVRGSLSISR